MQVTLDVRAVPAVSPAEAQAQRAQLTPGVGAQVIAVDLCPRMGAAAQVQRTVAIPRHQSQSRVLCQLPVDPGQQAANR
ncbi:hypothetical protein D3C80_1874670 [compost metagenome]